LAIDVKSGSELGKTSYGTVRENRNRCCLPVTTPCQFERDEVRSIPSAVQFSLQFLPHGP